MNKTTEQLIRVAKEKMQSSGDPVHDLSHAERVVEMVRSLIAADNRETTAEEIEALTLAAWWHDVGRTVYHYPSFVVMVFLDDLLSGFLLWREIKRLKARNSITRLAKRLIFCHSFGTGKILTRLLLHKHERHLLYILIDADRLDMIHTIRMEQLCELAASNRRYHVGYRFLTWYNLVTNKNIKVKTEPAQPFLTTALADFAEWFNSPAVLAWHEEKYGAKWVEKTCAALNVRSIRPPAEK